MNEAQFQARLIRKLYDLFPNCIILKNDTQYMQGVPDLTVLYYGCWAMLEVKVRKSAPTQPNQPYFINVLDEMSFAAFIYPENEEEILDALQYAFQFARDTRLPKR